MVTAEEIIKKLDLKPLQYEGGYYRETYRGGGLELAQFVVPRGIWQATRSEDGGHWALMGTTVVPGFEFEDFELGERADMIKLFPQHRNHIMRYTRDSKRQAQ